jgi:cell division protein FtsW (lipid II flippase)
MSQGYAISGAARCQPAELDPLLLWPALALLLFGLVMVYSASIATGRGQPLHRPPAGLFPDRHGVFLAIGLIAAVVVFQVPLRVWQQGLAVAVPRSAWRCWCWCWCRSSAAR